jgi:hypothetical protein
MHTESFYRLRAVLAHELSELPENIRRKRAYEELSRRWSILAATAAIAGAGQTIRRAIYIPYTRALGGVRR